MEKTIFSYNLSGFLTIRYACLLMIITMAAGQLVKTDGTVQPLIMQAVSADLLHIRAIDEDPVSGDILLGGETSSKAWIGLASAATAQDPQQLTWHFSLGAQANMLITDIFFTPDVVTVVGHKLAILVSASTSVATQFYQWMDPYATNADKHSGIANALSLTSPMIQLDMNKCLPVRHMVQMGQIIHFYFGTCDGTVSTGNTLNKVLIYMKWDVTPYPATIIITSESKLLNPNYRAGINQMPEFITTPDKSKIYIALSTPLNLVSASNIQNCVIKLNQPITPSTLITDAQTTQRCYNEPVTANCGDGTTLGCFVWQTGPMAYFDKLVGIIWAYLNHVTAPNTPNTTGSSEIRFYGECGTNLDTYIQLKFNGNVTNSFPFLMVAASSTTNYIAFHTSRVETMAYSGVVIYKVLFNPDPAGCASQAFLTAPKVTSHLMRYTETGGTTLQAMIGRKSIVYGTKTGAFLIGGYHTGFPSKTSAWSGKAFSTLTALKLADIDDMQMHTATATSLFTTTTYTLFDAQVGQSLSFFVGMYYTQKTNLDSTYFEPRTSLIQNCYRKLKVSSLTNFTASSVKQLFFNTIPGAQQVQELLTINITDIFLVLDITCPITSIGIDANFYGQALTTEQQSKLQVSGTTKIVGAGVMPQTMVSIWASNGIDKVYSPNFLLEIIDSACQTARPSLVALKTIKLISPIGINADGKQFIRPPSGTDSQSINLFTDSILSFPISPLLCSLVFTVSKIVDVNNQVLNPTGYSENIYIMNTGQVIFKDLRLTNVSAWVNAKMSVQVSSSTFSPLVFEAIQLQFQANPCDSVAVTYNSAIQPQILKITTQTYISGFDSSIQADQPATEQISLDIAPLVLSANPNLCPIKEYLINKVSGPTGTDLFNISWVQVELATGKVTLSNYNSLTEGTWSLYFKASTYFNYFQEKESQVFYQLVVSKGKCQQGGFIVNPGYLPISGSILTYMLKSEDGTTQTRANAAKPELRFSLSKSPIINNLQTDCPTVETGVTKVTLGIGIDLPSTSIAKVFKVDATTNELVIFDYGDFDPQYFNGTKVYLQSRSQFEVSPFAHFMTLLVGPYVCTQQEILNFNSPYVLEVDRPAETSSTKVQLDMSSGFFDRVGNPECSLVNYTIASVLNANEDQINVNKQKMYFSFDDKQTLELKMPNFMFEKEFQGALITFQAPINSLAKSEPTTMVKIKLNQLIEFDSKVKEDYTITVTTDKHGKLVEEQYWKLKSPKLIHQKGRATQIKVILQSKLLTHMTINSGSAFEVTIDRAKVTKSETIEGGVIFGDSSNPIHDFVLLKFNVIYKNLQEEEQSVEKASAKPEKTDVASETKLTTENTTSSNKETKETEAADSKDDPQKATENNTDSKSAVANNDDTLAEKNKVDEKASSESTSSTSGDADKVQKEPTAGEILAKAMEEAKKEEDKKELKELNEAGFDIVAGIGAVFPGVDMEFIKQQKKALTKLSKAQLITMPDPEVTLKPISSNGTLKLQFNQPMLISPTINETQFAKLFEFSHIANADGKKTVGRIVSQQELEMLMGEQNVSRRMQANETNQFEFFLTIQEVTDQDLKFMIDFKQPSLVSRSSGMDAMTVKFKHPRVFISKQSLKALDLDGSSSLKSKSMPPQLSPRMAAAIEEATDSGNAMFNVVSSGNFIVSLLIGGSLQKLWELIRSMQFLILNLLIKVPLPGHAFKFFQGCSIIAQLDIFDGSTLYVTIFDITDAPPRNENFELLGIGGKNFLINTGSIFIFLAGILIFNSLSKIASIIARLNARRPMFRKLGMHVYSESKLADTVSEMFKLFIEGYYDLAMCVALHNISFSEKYDENNTFADIYFSNATDSWISVVNLIITVLVLCAPIYCHYLLRVNQHQIDSSHFQEKYEVLLEGNTSSLESSLYTVYFLYRRFLSVLILVFLDQWPFFQCTFMMVLSSINVVYMLVVKPLQSKGDNRLDLFNEACILAVCHCMTICLNVALPSEANDLLGWVMVALTSLNILANLAIGVYGIIFEMISDHKLNKARERIDKFLAKREEIEEVIENNQELLKGQQVDIKMARVVRKCREWIPHRKWLIKMKIPLDQFPEEVEFQKYNEVYNLIGKAKMQRLKAAIDQANKKIKDERIQSNNTQLIINLNTFKAILMKQRYSRSTNTLQELLPNEQALLEKMMNRWKQISSPVIVSAKKKLNKSNQKLKKQRTANKAKNTTLEKIIEHENENTEDNIQSPHVKQTHLNKDYLQQFRELNAKSRLRMRSLVDKQMKEHHTLKLFDSSQVLLSSNFQQAELHQLEELIKKEEVSESDKVKIQEHINFRKECKEGKFNQIERQILGEELEDEMNLNFILNSSEAESEYGEEVYDRITNHGSQAFKDRQERPVTKPIENAGKNDFIQAVLQSLFAFDIIMEFLLLRKFQIRQHDNHKQPVCNVLHKLTNLYFLRELHLLETPSININFMAGMLNKTKKFTLNSNASAVGFLEYLLNAMLNEASHSDLIRSATKCATRETQMCKRNHVQTHRFIRSQPAILKVTGFQTISEFISQGLCAQTELPDKKCQFCKVEMDKAINNIQKLCQILIFNVKASQENGFSLEMTLDLKKHIDPDCKGNTKFILMAVITKQSTTNDEYLTFVKRNYETEGGKVGSEWFKFSKGESSVSSWEEIQASASSPEILMYRQNK